MNFDFLFQISLLLSLALLGSVLLLILGLMLTKTARQAWSRYAERRENLYKAILLRAIADEESTLDSLSRRNLRWRDRRLVERLLLNWSHGLSGHGYQRLCRLFSGCGFANHEVKRLRSGRWWVRAQAAQRLGQLRCAETMLGLIQALEDPVLEVRMMAAWALGRIGDASTADRIVQSLAHYSRLATLRAASITMAMGARTIPVLEKLLVGSDRDTRLLALELLGALGEKQAVNAILPFLSQDDLETRMAACRALGNIGDEGSFPAIERCLEDFEWQVRALAASIVGRHKIAHAGQKLKSALTDKAWWVRRNAGEALARLGDTGKKALEESLNAEDRFARDMAAQWLDELAAGSVR